MIDPGPMGLERGVHGEGGEGRLGGWDGENTYTELCRSRKKILSMCKPEIREMRTV